MSRLFYEFTVDKSTKSLHVKRQFNAELTLVWDAWTKAELIDLWWAPSEWKCKTKILQFEEGGMRHYHMNGPENAEHWGITTYDKIEFQKYFSGKECFSNESAQITDAFPVSAYYIEFNSKDELTFINHVTTYDELEHLDLSIQYGFENGMLGAFDNLDHYLGKQ